MAKYNWPPAAEAVRGILGGVATATVNPYRFTSYADNDAAQCESGFASGISQNEAAVASGGAVPIKVYGISLLNVNGLSVNIAAGDPIKPTTGGLGVKAATNKDKYSAIALGASTTDDDVILVLVERGVCNI